MNLREAILTEHSAAQRDKIVNWVGNSQRRFDELAGLFMSGEYRVVQRAAWPVSYFAHLHPKLVLKHLAAFIDILEKKDVHPAVHRNIVRLLQEAEVPENLQGRLMNACFRFVEDPETPVAVKAFSLTVLEKLAYQYPEIKPELKTIIEDRWAFETPAFRSRGRKILKAMEKTETRVKQRP